MASTQVAAAHVLQEAVGGDPQRIADEICGFITASVTRVLRRHGVVIGLSGGIDSSVCAALCVRALGADRVLGVFTPEAESAPESLPLGRLVADQLGIASVLEDITPILEGAGCYRRRDDAIRSVIPEYGVAAPGTGGTWRMKLVLPSLAETGAYRVSSVIAEGADGLIRRARLTPAVYKQVIAATSFKQRARKMVEYYHADRLMYAVVGTPNRLEFDQGFFVKNGDGAADVKPIAHLYKTQVYMLGAHLGIPDAVLRRPPTTDTFSLPQGQDEFYFSVPYQQMDLCLCGCIMGLPPEDVAAAVGLSESQVVSLYADIQNKRRSTRHLHMPPLTFSTESER